MVEGGQQIEGKPDCARCTKQSCTTAGWDLLSADADLAAPQATDEEQYLPVANSTKGTNEQSSCDLQCNAQMLHAEEIDRNTTLPSLTSCALVICALQMIQHVLHPTDFSKPTVQDRSTHCAGCA